MAKFATYIEGAFNPPEAREYLRPRDSFRGPNGAEQNVGACVELMNETEREAWGLYEVTSDPIPAGHRAVSWDRVDRAGKPVDVPTTEPNPVTPDMVRQECSRRLQATFGARDEQHLSVILSNAGREATRLLDMHVNGIIDATETARMAELRGADAVVEALRAKSNALEALDPIPMDYSEDKHWV